MSMMKRAVTTPRLVAGGGAPARSKRIESKAIFRGSLPANLAIGVLDNDTITAKASGCDALSGVTTRRYVVKVSQVGKCGCPATLALQRRGC
jgi:hypothetical protein